MVHICLKTIADLGGHDIPVFHNPQQYLLEFNIYNPFCLSFEGLTLIQLRQLIGHTIEKIDDLNKRNRIYKAFRQAQEIHSRQVRDNNDPYLMHALKVAILASILNEKFKADFALEFLFEAALLHDTREDHPEYWAWFEQAVLAPTDLPDDTDQKIINLETISKTEVRTISEDPRILAKYFVEVNSQKFILPNRLIRGKLKYPQLDDLLKERLMFKKNIPTIEEDRHLNSDQKNKMKALRDRFLKSRTEIRDKGYAYLEREYPQSLTMKLYDQMSVAKMIYLLSKPHVLGMTFQEREAAIQAYYQDELGKAPNIVKLIKLADRFSNLYDLKHVEDAPGRYLKLIKETREHLVPMIERSFSRKINLWVKHMLEPNQMNRQAAVGNGRSRNGGGI